ncbi:hypothetical protein CALCODRAFT_522095 [Calocera cornea HHB12733]|uniref:F-box domain-containing protein n=1 Tax=Calocera cornea HHB12733 TaxID=1353952 RepID=A0A165C2A9_9BASI|nr:hypothetical protein CALCODRAFT_522095 [Calocera cornea HHB12733]
MTVSERRHRFAYLSSLVREINLEAQSEDLEYFDSVPEVSALFLLAGTSTEPHEPLFPNMTRLSVTTSVLGELELIQLLGHSPLQDLLLCIYRTDTQLEINDHENEGEYWKSGIVACLDWVADTIPDLRTLSLNVPSWEGDVLGMYDFCLTPTPDALVEFTANGAFFTPGCLDRLCNAPMLENLSLDMETFPARTDSNPALWASNDLIPTHGFLRLSNLRLHQTYSGSLAMLKRIAGPLHTIRLRLPPEDEQGEEELEELAIALSSFSGTLTQLEIHIGKLKSETIPHPHSWKTFAPLLACNKMQRVSLKIYAATSRSTAIFQIQDVDLCQIASCWPQLQHLVLSWPSNPTPAAPLSAPSGYEVTVQGVVDLFRGCSALRRLQIPQISFKMGALSPATTRAASVQKVPVKQTAIVSLQTCDLSEEAQLHEVGTWLARNAPKLTFRPYSSHPYWDDEEEGSASEALTHLRKQLDSLNLARWTVAQLKRLHRGITDDVVALHDLSPPPHTPGLSPLLPSV